MKPASVILIGVMLIMISQLLLAKFPTTQSASMISSETHSQSQIADSKWDHGLAIGYRLSAIGYAFRSLLAICHCASNDETGW